MMLRNLMIVMSLLCGTALAADAPPPPPLEPVPDLAPQAPQSSETVEPQVTIVQRKEETIEEYRIHGQLYMIKVTPKKGPPYYLVDTNGDGRLDARRSELDPKLLIPAWVIFKWK